MITKDSRNMVMCWVLLDLGYVHLKSSYKTVVGSSPPFLNESLTDLDNIIIILMKSRYCSRQLANISDHVTSIAVSVDLWLQHHRRHAHQPPKIRNSDTSHDQ
jgi:hypothetical protein